jgi:hypothetical protein
MFRITYPFVAAFLVFAQSPASAQSVVVGFEDLPSGFTATPPGTGSYTNGQYYSPSATASSSSTFTSYATPSVGATFNTVYNYYQGFGGFSSGWSSSSVFNNQTAGSSNQYAAYNAAGATGQNGSGLSATYGIANGSSAGVTLPTGYRINSIDITNTTYTYISMRDGDQFAKKFGGTTGTDPDYFMLTITGKNAGGGVTGSKDFYLADFTSPNAADHYILNHWTTVDLSGLGADTKTLSFTWTSTDVGQFGMNTPAYFAADNLVLALVPVPEPGSVLAIAAGAGLLWRWRKRKAK